MSYLDCLSADLLIIIYEFNVSHRKDFAPSLDLVKIEGIKSRLRHIDNLGDYVEHAYRSEIEDPGYFVKMLSKCACCPRHAINRPSSINDVVVETETVSPFKVYTCECPCRSNARWIIRSCT
jgi:hypothetical protein